MSFASAAGGALVAVPGLRPRLDRQLLQLSPDALSPQPSRPTCRLADLFHDTPEYHRPRPDEPHTTTMAAVAQMPAGATHTHLQAMKRTFNNVPVAADNAISTEEFLEAAESLTTMFDLLGSVAFSPVKKDMLGNVEVWTQSPSPFLLRKR